MDRPARHGDDHAGHTGTSSGGRAELGVRLCLDAGEGLEGSVPTSTDAGVGLAEWRCHGGDQNVVWTQAFGMASRNYSHVQGSTSDDCSDCGNPWCGRHCPLQHLPGLRRRSRPTKCRDARCDWLLVLEDAFRNDSGWRLEFSHQHPVANRVPEQVGAGGGGFERGHMQEDKGQGLLQDRLFPGVVWGADSCPECQGVRGDSSQPTQASVPGIGGSATRKAMWTFG